MNHDLLKSVIYDQHEIIRDKDIVIRDTELDIAGNFIIVGMRRAGKSTLLYSQVQKLVSEGVDWNQILYINFEDERLAEFTSADFNDILIIQGELSTDNGYFFFDEIQNIDGWEKFARRMADADRNICITGSNAKMLSRDMEKVLGGRYISKLIYPYNFGEYLRACGVGYTDKDMHTSRKQGMIRSKCQEYLHYGGLPETLRYKDKREYISSVYNKILLGDIIVRNGIRNENIIKVLIKKIAETVTDDISYSKLYGIMKAVGFSVSKDTIIDYICYAKDSYLMFDTHNFYMRFADRESNPRYYFTDNGVLSLFIRDRDSSLLENAVATYLHANYGDEVYYLKDVKKGIDVDFYVPESNQLIQAAYEINEGDINREISSLAKASKSIRNVERYMVVTMEQEFDIDESNIHIEVVPLYKFLLGN